MERLESAFAAIGNILETKELTSDEKIKVMNWRRDVKNER